MEERLSLLYPSIDRETLSAVIGHAESFALDYCNLQELPSSLAGTIYKMCRQELNQLLAEGLSSESSGGSSLAYLEDWTPDVYKQLRKHKRIKVL